ncbi:hypothetical protein A2631_03940 [Candidatus Daviesbacteria bacterium RIFCSPHIGHO2_01_FULL_44_29]|uniref:Uncharacterized protein n=1 Tax=Candidatus Daviesbacteria bacterium RIFCSPHIGHO2_02_FULL_43_12 TaxID=1797776 RepID=A0A1F5KG11_9BACT|nr:MAG: hypothetical protein A2631_03940 [Candidatus Daviesbacteria bacterium RIFCSPHIGHO2_01_FULL_44_29]OGE39883.1 MAG: hypothetical protein A3D25_03670 [Candidatus Daviesbacteria bacterium RIFCSPHIGHO2_02_FULL_43_12]OGE40680.1 MAG: hypothetical protein A3E86_04220 [Candidatus Daviesbacteria bacterium RIFCSPHIGHO2_12_FULL_47_45]OGE70436.1 MAG: hypothetical protein A3B55_01900 [Candidatus Daviesbacteria bacterium RIFCSPLOWO2_01_FULL_43_15]
MIISTELREIDYQESTLTPIAKIGTDSDDTLRRCESLLVAKARACLGRDLKYKDLHRELKHSTDPEIRDLLRAVTADPTFFHRRGFYKRTAAGLALLHEYPLNPVVITGRSKKITPRIENEFDDLMRLITDIHQIPQDVDLNAAKAQILVADGIRDHIDDNITILVAAAKAATARGYVLHGHLIRRPWNRTITQKGLTREFGLGKTIEIHPSFYRAAKSIINSGRYPRTQRLLG